MKINPANTSAAMAYLLGCVAAIAICLLAKFVFKKKLTLNQAEAIVVGVIAVGCVILTVLYS
ncbi:hypothetical protein [Variovorax sp. YR216]|uniref:hypothetical protein n=1 Tax=Variovorax sp. YR216 TaxID=1882828 RepID=UPI00089D36CD|nr:hypothetical protein [Variovorax sp. YR216]SEB25404.1 hypothetical protein SAMN05444680_12518 [Variovorax sp. YR216]